MRHKYERSRVPKQQGGGRCLLVSLVLLVWVVLAGLVVLRGATTHQLVASVQRRLALTLPSTAIPMLVPTTKGTKATAAPNIVQVPPADRQLPIGTQPIVITDSAANEFFQQHRDQVPGIDQVAVHFEPGVVTADLTAAGFTSTARSGIAIENGRVVAVDPQLGPPLNYVVDVQTFAQLLENRLNGDLAARHRTVTAVRIEPGKMIINMQ